MKHILITLSLFLSLAASSQVVLPYKVSSVTAMKSYAGAANKITVEPGGSTAVTEYVLCTSCIADESTIYAGVSPRKWKLIASGGGGSSTSINYVNITTFGAVPGGTDNRTAIQNALNSAYVSGLSVYIPKAEYTISSVDGTNRSLTVPKGVKIIGADRDSSILNFTSTAAGNVAINVGGQSVSLSNFTIKTDSANSSGAITTAFDNTLIDKMTLSGGAAWGVFSTFNKGTVISNCKIFHTGTSNGIEINNTINNKLIDNEIFSNVTSTYQPTRGNAIEVYTTKGNVANRPYGNIVSRNYIHNHTSGIFAVADSLDIFSDNIIENTKFGGIVVIADDVSSTVNAKQLIISRNIVKKVNLSNGSNSAIQITGSYHNVYGNTVDSLITGNAYGIINYSQNSTINSNVISNTSSSGIFNHPSAGYNTISGNILINNSRGINNQANYVSIVGNSVSDFRIPVVSDYAIYNNANNINVIGNTGQGNPTFYFNAGAAATTEVSADRFVTATGTITGAASVGTSLSIGVSQGTDFLEINKSVAGKVGSIIRNATSTGSGSYDIRDDANHLTQYGKWGSAKSAYKNILQGSSFLYNDGLGDISLLNDYSSGNISFLAAAAANPQLKINSASIISIVPVTATQYKLSALNTAPTSAADTGTTGEIRFVNGFLYLCVATNTWQRTSLATW